MLRILVAHPYTALPSLQQRQARTGISDRVVLPDKKIDQTVQRIDKRRKKETPRALFFSSVT